MKAEEALGPNIPEEWALTTQLMHSCISRVLVANLLRLREQVFAMSCGGYGTVSSSRDGRDKYSG